MNQYTPIRELKGIGEKTEKLFAKLGIFTLQDLIQYFPRGYDIYEDPVPISNLEEGKVQTVTGAVFGKIQVSGSRSVQVTSLYLKDLTGTLKVVWFRMPYLRNTLSGGGILTLRGIVTHKKSGLVMEHPELFYPASKYNEKLHTMQPLYPLTAGLSNNTVMKAMRQALDNIPLSRELLPESIRLKYHLSEYNYALRGIHFPEDREVYFHARNRLVFEEFAAFIYSLRRLKTEKEESVNHFHIIPRKEIEAFIQKLPYTLTLAQQRVWSEILKDMQKTVPMSRLVQGDVGSGKTIVAFLALATAGLNGYQGALMAPTEVLARQHYESVTSMLKTYQIPLTAELLTGSMTAREKKNVYRKMACGEADLIIGTHALIQEKAVYKNLALVVTDEQHRFGVRQREMLAGKGDMPHVLVMSATPIPRTLAIILYGDLDISVIDELPANRLPIKNCVVDTGYRKNAYHFIENQVKEGRQCYIICPMVEESEHLEVENVTDYAAMLQEELGPQIVVDFLHGKMKQEQKDEIMTRFSQGQIHVLVSTTVIEVGINVPNATVMMVENAERFGLAQLHQLRGRVGRGSHQSYCIFMTGSKAKETKERLDILNKSNDGFKIAAEDLKMRGPGDLFGIRQSGLMDFKLGDVFQDARLLQIAGEALASEEAAGSEWLAHLEKQAQNTNVIL